MSTDHNDASSEPLTIAVTATFMAEALEPALAFWMQELDIPARIVFAPYNQVFQELLNPSSLLAGNRNGINVVLVRLEDWQKGETSAEAGPESCCPKIERNARDLVQALIGAVGRSPTFHLVCLCPAPPVQTTDPQRGMTFQRMENRIVSDLEEVNGVHVVTTAELSAAYPVAHPHDPHGEEMAHIPYTPMFFTALATMIARKVYALRNARSKVLVFDADQTLWGGYCGEDGPLAVRIDPARQAVQEFLVRQRAGGMLLCLCSKNNEDDVAKVFEGRPDMPLRRDHLTGWRVNWGPKSENIKSLARELQLGLDSFIFLDDDPLECAEVQAHCPEVLTLPLPRDADRIPRFLRNIWAFDRMIVTGEGRERATHYQQHLQRRQFRTESLTLKDFLTGLGLKVQISAAAPHQLARVAELTQRTNQFNFTGVRRSEAEIQHLCRQGQMDCLVVHAKDRFGDYGLVGVVLFLEESGGLAVDTFLLSCRALGRGVEHRMLARLGEVALEKGLSRVDVPYRRTGKNQPALDFLDGASKGFQEVTEDGFLFRFPAGVAAAVLYHPPDPDQAPGQPVQRSSLSTPGATGAVADTLAQAARLRSIAEELSDVEQIHPLVVSCRARPDLTTPFVAPRTAIETQLAEMYAELLGADRVGVNDNFFDMGGHSLLATQVLSRVREAFQVELSPSLLFSGQFTVAELAKTVAKQQVQRAEPQEIAAVLQKLNELSDDEVRALLGGQTDRLPPSGAG